MTERWRALVVCGVIALAMVLWAASGAWANSCAKAAMYGGHSGYWNTMCMWEWIVDFLVT